MQYCDSTCQQCARSFFRWWKSRVKQQDAEPKPGRSGPGNFNVAAATSVVAV